MPGALAAYNLTLKKCGRLSLAELLLPAADIAEHGFPIDAVYARRLAAKADTLAKYAGSRAVLLKPDGSPYHEGEVLRQPDLARSYRHIAEEGPEWFYQGMVRRERSPSGWRPTAGSSPQPISPPTAPVEREPIVTTYREWRIAGFPAAQFRRGSRRPDAQHPRAVRSEGRVPTRPGPRFTHRGGGDEARFRRPGLLAGRPPPSPTCRVGLVDKAYGRELAERICPEAASVVRSHGQPPDANAKLFDRHTTHIAAADSEGYWVAITATVNTGFGSKVIVPGTGIVLNDEMDDFSSQPGVPNAFGLIGAENNSVAAGKRPLSSMSPTIVMQADGTPVLAVGAAGGPKIITQVLLTVIRTLDLGYKLADAVGAPRFHHQWSPDKLIVEPSSPESLIQGLKRYGHSIGEADGYGITQAVGVDASGRLEGVHDPRVPGKVGYGQRADSE